MILFHFPTLPLVRKINQSSNYRWIAWGSRTGLLNQNYLNLLTVGQNDPPALKTAGERQAAGDSAPVYCIACRGVGERYRDTQIYF
jgi:hypothetical protein